jgi:hypothetical protein
MQDITKKLIWAIDGLGKALIDTRSSVDIDGKKSAVK